MTQITTRRKPAEITVLVVRLGARCLALPIESVEEVLPALPIESVPQCPSFLLGVVFVRGHLIPVLSAAERLGMRDYQRPDEPHIVCLRQNDQLIGVEFDEALDLMNLEAEDCLTVDQLGTETGFLRGLVEHEGLIIRLLDPEKLIAKEEVSTLQRLPKTRDRVVV